MSSSELFGDRQADFFTRIFMCDLRDDLPADLIAAIKPGEEFGDVIEGRSEPLIIRVSREIAGDLIEGEKAYFEAIRKGLVAKSTPYGEFAVRELVTVYSESHGGRSFVYDAQSGTRILPKGDLSGLNSVEGDRVIAATAIAQEFVV